MKIWSHVRGLVDDECAVGSARACSRPLRSGVLPAAAVVGGWSRRKASSRPIIVNAGAWADRFAARLDEPVPLEAVALMLMITVPIGTLIAPLVIMRGRKLSFKQLARGAVPIGGEDAGRAHRDGNRAELDWRRLAESARTVPNCSRS
jgi:hypothetical protein